MISPIQSNSNGSPSQAKSVDSNASAIGVMDSVEKGSKHYGQFSEKSVQAAFKEVNTREYMAFGRLAGDASNDGIINFGKAYIAYYDSLSLADRQAKRYAGTRESVASMVAAAEGQKQQEGRGNDTQEIKTTNLMDLLFEQTKEVLRKKGIDLTGSGAIVTISDAAAQAFNGSYANKPSETYESLIKLRRDTARGLC
jgi:hypothetical protein